jgi:hypothetical protein
MHLFLAEGVERGDADPMPDEEFELVRWPIEAVASHLDEIEDAKDARRPLAPVEFPLVARFRGAVPKPPTAAQRIAAERTCVSQDVTNSCHVQEECMVPPLS